MAGVIAQLTANARKRREGGCENVAIEKVVCVVQSSNVVLRYELQI